MINRSFLLRRLRLAALVRSLITLGSLFIFIPLAPLIAMIPGLGRQKDNPAGVIALFGGPLLVSWIVTNVLCKRMVQCPCCDGSLWECGTGNFKPRRMKIRAGITSCPHCGLPISRR